MEIFWLDQSVFRLKGKGATVLINLDGVSVEEKVFSGAGEYESKGVMITGIGIGENTIYSVTLDNLNIVHLGNSDFGNLEKQKLEEVDQVDILLTPQSAPVADLEPKIIIPYSSDKESLDKLTKELGAEGVASQPKLSITKDKLPDEPMVVVLEHGK